MARRHLPKDFAERLLGGPVVWVGLILLTAFAMGPFLWMLLTSLKDRTELYATPLQYLPRHPTFENYVEAWSSPVTPFSRFFLNSLWVCSVTMVATTIVSVLAGYAIARFKFACKTLQAGARNFEWGQGWGQTLSRTQTRMMTGVLLPKPDPQSHDACDALAIAITHANHRQSIVLKVAAQ